jgi:hypothetical protein
MNQLKFGKYQLNGTHIGSNLRNRLTQDLDQLNLIQLSRTHSSEAKTVYHVNFPNTPGSRP